MATVPAVPSVLNQARDSRIASRSDRVALQMPSPLGTVYIPVCAGSIAERRTEQDVNQGIVPAAVPRTFVWKVTFSRSCLPGDLAC